MAPMSRSNARILLFQAALVTALAAALPRSWFPLGVPGEWEWLRHHAASEPLALALAGIGAGAYVLLVASGFQDLVRRTSRPREALWISALVVAALGVQVAIPYAAPSGLGLTRWTTLGLRGSSGYFQVAKGLERSPAAFLADYPRWITRQDALHIGTHPPGLILLAATVSRTLETHPGIAASIDACLPREMHRGFRLILGPLRPPERAAMVLVGSATLLACALVVVPLYVLARSSLAPPWAWAAAAFWPLVPSAILFQPAADAWYPLLSTTALALAVPGKGAVHRAVVCGIVLAVGMQFSLVFLAVGLLIALGRVAGCVRKSETIRRCLLVLGAIGAGFLAATLAFWAVARANPLAIWLANARNHARFYEQFPRAYRSWVVANGMETLVAIGLPAAVWMVLGLGRRGTLVSWATLIVLAVLTLSGRNLSEVARLWLPFFPALLIAAGRGLERRQVGPGALAVTIGLMAAQTLALQAVIQVVYPVV